MRRCRRRLQLSLVFLTPGRRLLQYEAYADRTMSGRLKGLTRKWSSSDIAEGMCHHSSMLP